MADVSSAVRRFRGSGVRFYLEATNTRLIILSTASKIQVFRMPITGTNATETSRAASHAPKRSNA